MSFMNAPKRETRNEQMEKERILNRRKECKQTQNMQSTT